MGLNTATIDFGAWPGSYEASVVVPEAGIATNSHIEPYVMADDSTTDHTTSDHKYLPLFASFTAGGVIDGVSYVIYGRARERLQGEYAVNAAWV